MKRNLKLFLLFVAGGFSIVAFQNCGNQELAFQDSLLDDTLSFFNYKYTAASPYYHDIKVLKGPITANAKTFQVIGTISRTSPDDTTPLSWRIRLMDSTGAHLPTISGDITTNGTTVYEVGMAGLAGRVYTTLWVEITYGSEVIVETTSLGEL